eukprot:Em0005g458a
MCLVDEKNDSVLEISDDKVIFNPNVDFTNLNQHWYIYPYSQRDKTFTIVSRKEQKLLQLHDNKELTVIQCDSEGVAVATIWTIDHGYFHTESKRFKVYPMGHSSLVIMDCKQDIDNWQLECESTKVVLQVTKIVHKNTGSVLSTDNGNSKLSICLRNCLPHSIQDQFWVLDYRLDGTFLIISDTKEKLVLSCHSSTSTPEESQLVMSQFNGDENELWSFDGGHVESVKFKDRVISLMPGSQTSLCLTTKSTTDSAQLFQPESYTPVLIRCLMDDTVLELDDASVLKFSAVDETWPDSQVWYIKYRNGFSDPSFMIISKKNGQALQVVESNVESKEIEPTNENQQWKRDGLFIFSLKGYHKQMTYDFKSANVMATGEDHKLVLRSHSLQKSNCYFEFKHFATSGLIGDIDTETVAQLIEHEIMIPPFSKAFLDGTLQDSGTELAWYNDWPAQVGGDTSTVPANSAPQGLQSMSEVMRANSKLCVPARASTLAVKLARDAIFGEEVMLQSTLTGGRGGFKALPAEGMAKLKHILLLQFPTIAPPESLK